MAVDNKKSKKASTFITRFFSGIVLITILAFVLYTGGTILFLLCAILSILGLVELFQVFKLEKSGLALIAYILTVFYYMMLLLYRSSGILLFLIALLLLLLMFYVLSFPKYNIKQVSMIFFGIIYVAVTLSFVYLIRTRNNYGKYFVWLIFISSWGSDTFAYCTGMLFGKHKFSKNLSPNKTVEGVVGGILGASLLGALYTYIIFYKVAKDISFSCLQVAIACAIGAIISMLGDLAASAIKRDFNVKDYGNIIPGHGGILDRFDSVIFTAPALYFILSI